MIYELDELSLALELDLVTGRKLDFDAAQVIAGIPVTL